MTPGSYEFIKLDVPGASGNVPITAVFLQGASRFAHSLWWGHSLGLDSSHWQEHV